MPKRDVRRNVQSPGRVESSSTDSGIGHASPRHRTGGNPQTIVKNIDSSEDTRGGSPAAATVQTDVCGRHKPELCPNHGRHSLSDNQVDLCKEFISETVIFAFEDGYNADLPHLFSTTDVSRKTGLCLDQILNSMHSGTRKADFEGQQSLRYMTTQGP